MTYLTTFAEAAIVLIVIFLACIAASGISSLLMCWWQWLMFQVDKSISEHTDATGL